MRFTARMDRASTEAAFSARIGTKKLKGTFSWAERDTVLVFKPAAVFAFRAKVVVQVATTATDRGGTPLAAAKSATFKVEAKPAAARRPGPGAAAAAVRAISATARASGPARGTPSRRTTCN